MYVDFNVYHYMELYYRPKYYNCDCDYSIVQCTEAVGLVYHCMNTIIIDTDISSSSIIDKSNIHF